VKREGNMLRYFSKTIERTMPLQNVVPDFELGSSCMTQKIRHKSLQLNCPVSYIEKYAKSKERLLGVYETSLLFLLLF
jgi:hypothetical protein